MSARLGHVLAFISACLICPALLHADAKWESLDFITEELPPYNYTESGIARGIAVDILLEAAAGAGLPIARRDIRSLPWARGYQMVKKGPGVLLFSMARTDERGPQFKWVGPIMANRIVLLARKDRQLQITQPADLSAYRIGVIAIGAAVAIGLTLWLRFSRIGLFVRAASTDPITTSMQGVNTDAVSAGVVGLGSALAGLAGVVAAPFLSLSPHMSSDVLIESFVVVVIGGLGSLAGAFVAALLLGMMQALGAVYLPEVSVLLPFIFMIAVLIWKPSGLAGSRT